jgi:polyhydroxybutyrate depolymerase
VKLKRILLTGAAVLIGTPLLLLLVAVGLISYFDTTNGTVVASGVEREYLIHVPASYDPSKPAPLVISLHAAATWPAHQKNLSRWNRVADQNGFIVVYPSGTPQLFGAARIWRTTPTAVMRDVQFISALVDRLEATYTIDRARIYANGMSNGAGMAFALSCTMSDRIAAIGMVAAAPQLPSAWCTDRRPVPVMVFHGTADEIVPYEGGRLGDPFNPVKPVFPAVRTWLANWARRNGCAPNPVESTIAHGVRRTEYQDCAEDATVVLHSIVGGGHSWPGGKPPPEWWVGPTSASIDATSALWTFFMKHPLDP